MRRSPVPITVAAGLAATGLASVVLAACGSSARPAGDADLPQRPASAAVVRTLAVAGVGTVLADGRGRTLYMFPPDAKQRVSCTGACAGTWPPLAVTSGADVTAKGGADRMLLGTRPDPNTGGRIVTYNGYPLYTYAGDVGPGTANGQAIYLDGGPWYVLGADGTPRTTAARR